MSQEKSILNHLKSGKTITPLEALDQYGCMRLAAVINNLRQQGHNILTEMINNDDKHYARYKYYKESEKPKMNKSEWQAHHGFDNEDMELIESCKSIWNGKIASVINEHRWK